MKRSLTLLSLIVISGLATSQAQAARFTIQNLSNRTVVVAIRYWLPGEGLTGIVGIPGTPARWVTEGWTVVPPNRSVSIVSGNKDHCYVRMSYDHPKNGQVIVPPQHGGEQKFYVHSEPFQLIENVDRNAPQKRFMMRSGVGYRNVKVEADPKNLGGEEMDGFYKLPVKMTYTIGNGNERGPFTKVYYFNYQVTQNRREPVFGVFRAPRGAKIVDYRLNLRNRIGARVFWNRGLSAVSVRGFVNPVARGIAGYTGTITIRYVFQ